ncbi:nicotinate-nucleotide adenylyltransferase [Bartonella tamiae]|uniref:Probable nicotinate-nucleotide adenylyltransferase n=1 Tax=Bartonella tamiae Th239 TaxID=1094558 RepID=J0ZPB2_9HYPH|nr:nicotinate-nucleotide adenylyltransferase [Bartonella tamiae]EJF90398.1 nicotinate (nicotinamide) nucleotide adenylyltransferase [Bartonella tamiae Th239]EJF93658.1 nicotinate (nicotinamide) nucleotide adenylyltransferase [Bartonella tamiae Th307]
MPYVESGNVVGLFGGSFNPPHDGHVLVAKTAIQRLGLQQLWWMVTPGNPLKDNRALPSLQSRICLSTKMIDDPRIKITGFEEKIGAYTSIMTIRHILKRHKGVYFVWIMGGDSLSTFHHWHCWRDIVHTLPIAIIDRPMAKKAVLSAPMAQTYQKFRIKEEQSTSLPYMKAPAWVYIHAQRSNTSSTALRQQNDGK